MPYYIYVENINQTSATVDEGEVVRFWLRRTDASSSETLLFSTRQGTATYDEGDYQTSTGGEPLDIPVTFEAGIFFRSIDITVNVDESENAGQSEAFGALLFASNGTTQLAALSRDAVTIVDVPPPLPNLTIADVDVGNQDLSNNEIVTTTYAPGDTFSVVVDVDNDGPGVASSSVLGLYLVQNGNAQIVATNNTNSLSSGASDNNETLSFTLPNNLTEGRYELLVKTDYNDNIDETDIGDNIQSFFIDVVANQPPAVMIEAALTYATGTVLDGTDLISVTDPDGSSDIQNILLYDAINSPGAIWRFNGTIIDPGGAGNQFELSYDNLNLLTYTVGTGSDSFSFEARDFSGNISDEAGHTITAIANDPPVVQIEAASSYVAGTVLTGTDLISVTDPDGSTDIQNILLYDAVNAPNAIWRFNGTIIDPGGTGSQFELSYDNLNLLTYTVGTGDDSFSFEARDFSGNISNEASHTITDIPATSLDDVREGTDTSVSLDESSWRSGTINAEPISGDGETSDSQGGFIDKDWYRVTLAADRTYSFEAQSQSLSTGLVFIRLYDGSGNLVSGATEAEGSAPNFTYSTAAQSGNQTFYVAVSAGDINDSDFQTATGDFRVRFTDEGPLSTSDVAATTSTNATLAVGTTVVGEIQQDDVSGDYIDSDYFRVTLTGGQRYTFSADADVSGNDTLDEVFIRLRDAQGQTLSPDVRDEGANADFVFDTPGSDQQTFYLAVSAGGDGTWWDDIGTYSVSLTAEGDAPPTNYRPVAEATDQIGDPGDVIPLSELFSYSDPDGLSDIVSFAVQDRTSVGGHLTYLGQQMSANTVYERSIDEIGDWAFVVGPPGTDDVGFNAIDSAGAFNTSVVASVSGSQLQGPVALASADDLFGQEKLSTLAHFSLAAYPREQEALDQLSEAGWGVFSDIDFIAAGIPNEMFSNGRFKNYDVLNLDYGIGDALLAKSEDEQTLVVSFAGSENLDWINNLNVLNPFDIVNGQFELFSPILDLVEQGLNSELYQKVYVTGHSLGGAMAQALKHHFSNDARVEGVVFANPGLIGADLVLPGGIPPVFGDLEDFVNITLDGDIIEVAQAVLDNEGDRYELTNLVGPGAQSVIERGALHGMQNYVEIAAFLDDARPDIIQNSGNSRIEDQIIFVPLDDGQVQTALYGFNVSQAGIEIGDLATGNALNGNWSFGYDLQNSGVLTVDTSSFTNTDWTVSAVGDQVLLSDLANQELLRSSGFDSLQINSTLADLNLTIEQLEGTSILNETVYVSAGVGNDNIDGSTTDRRIVASGAEGDDTIFGGTPGDQLSGDHGNDVINGGGGDDYLDGGAGNDLLDGGDGADELVDGLGNDQLSGGDDDDQLIALSGANALSGGGSSDFLLGGFQADNLNGGSGNDVLRGDAGNFMGGSDVLTGGADDDLLMGGAGADMFVFNTNDGADIIASFDVASVGFDPVSGYSGIAAGADFQTGVDQIELAGFTTVNASNVMSSITDGAEGAVFNAEGTSITFYDIAAGQITADDFLFV